MFPDTTLKDVLGNRGETDGLGHPSKLYYSLQERNTFVSTIQSHPFFPIIIISPVNFKISLNTNY
jgi:hypothetical protein